MKLERLQEYQLKTKSSKTTKKCTIKCVISGPWKEAEGLRLHCSCRGSSLVARNCLELQPQGLLFFPSSGVCIRVHISTYRYSCVYIIKNKVDLKNNTYTSSSAFLEGKWRKLNDQALIYHEPICIKTEFSGWFVCSSWTTMPMTSNHFCFLLWALGASTLNPRESLLLSRLCETISCSCHFLSPKNYAFDQTVYLTIKVSHSKG